MRKRGETKEEEWRGLMRLALEGDQLAYKKLLSAVTPHIRGVVRRCLPGMGTPEIEDVVQETLLAVHLKRTTWDASLPFLPWLNAVARHKTIDAARRKGGRVEVEFDDSVAHLAVVEGDGDSSLDADTVLAALDRRDRSIVEQIYLQGRTAAEVGTQLGMNEGAVRVALHRALKALSRKFNGSSS